MKKNHKGYGKLSFLNKVRISLGILIVIPVLLLECLVLYLSIHFIREQQQLEVKGGIERNYQDIENKLSGCENSLAYLVSNRTLIEFMGIPDEDYLERNTATKNVSSLIYNTLLSGQYFKKIEIYSDKNIAINDDIFKNIADSEDSSWYEETLATNKPVWKYEQGKYYIMRRISTILPEKQYGVVRIQIKDNLFIDSMSAFVNIPIEIHLKNGNHSLVRYDNYDKSTGNLNVEEIRKLENSDWEMVYSVDQTYFSNIFHPQIILSFAVVVLLLVIEFFALNSCTKGLLKYLYRLIDDVKQVKDNNFQIYVDESAQDEIGELAKSINQMLSKIQILIEEVYKSKLEQKSLELEVLQSKINPHFLYNNLSSINWIAIEKGEDKIYQITTELATFYRTALNKGVNVDALSVELNNIKAYINLQLIAHENSFKVYYDIEERLLQEKVPIFVMQPLVENAIEHGIDSLRDVRGEISIRVRCASKDEQYDESVVIEIKDNGTELYDKIGKSMLPQSDYGYGVGNVHKRVRLLCGEKYGVRIYADEEGTTSQIRIRRNLLILENGCL